MGCQERLGATGSTCCARVTDSSTAAIPHSSQVGSPCALGACSSPAFLCSPWLSRCCGENCTLQVSRGWMSGSHLLTEEVSNFPRACIKRGLCTAVPCTGTTFILQRVEWKGNYKSKTESFKQSLWLEEEKLSFVSVLLIISVAVYLSCCSALSLLCSVQCVAICSQAQAPRRKRRFVLPCLPCSYECIICER